VPDVPEVLLMPVFVQDKAPEPSLVKTVFTPPCVVGNV
jgi:hypothetical protein